MRYHYEKPDLYSSTYGITYECEHPIYDRCTLFKIGKKGLAVIQQRFNRETKVTFWTEIDPWLTDLIYLHRNFKEYFDERAKEPEYDIYPTVTVRQLMWAVKIKPIPRERWETCFDRKNV